MRGAIFRFWLAGIFLLGGAALAPGQTMPPQAVVAEPEEKPRELPPPRPPLEPGYFPGIAPPSSQTTWDQGPVTGVMAPYGNPAAYDTLLRGWTSRRVGPFLVSPYLEYNGIYDSNIFQTATDKKSDFINVINPGLRLELPIAGLHKLSVGYLGNYFLYSEHSDVSHYDHNANLDAAVHFRGGLSLRCGNTFRRATEIPSAEFDRERPYLRDTPYFIATYAFADRWKLQGSYQFDLLRFDQAIDKPDNYYDHMGGATLYYRFWPKTALLTQFLVSSRTYPHSPADDNLSFSPLLGLTWDPTAKITGTAKFGYTFKDYSQNLPGRNNAPESFILSVQTIYRHSRYDTISLTAQRAINEDVDFGNTPYNNTGVFCAWHHDWHYFKVQSYVSFSYVNNRYLAETFDPGTGTFQRRNDDVLAAGAGLSRPLNRWLRLRLDYLYADRSSNFANFAYNEHRVLFGLQGSL